MLAVITIDQRSSRRAAEIHADEWAAELNERYRDELIRPFTATLGDEIQGIVGGKVQGVAGAPRAIIDILLGGVREQAWWLGLGIGDVETPLRQTAARSRGPAFYNAREAVEAAKRSHHGFAVRAEDTSSASDLQTVLELLAFLIRRRGHDPLRWQAVELAGAGKSTVEIGKALGITQQAASKRLRNAGFYEEVQGRELAERILGKAMGRRNAR
ncbi:MAG TPA: SatD family protein [Solirubrobacterales bacterium]|nr:SatD family protein [Solirubrobacterales bacterium]